MSTVLYVTSVSIKSIASFVKTSMKRNARQIIYILE